MPVFSAKEEIVDGVPKSYGQDNSVRFAKPEAPCMYSNEVLAQYYYIIMWAFIMHYSDNTNVDTLLSWNK